MSELEKLENTVSEHAISIALMTRAVSSIEALLTQQTVSIKEIEKAMKSQELLMEKFTHLDTRISDSVNRIHKRLDSQEVEFDSFKKETRDSIRVINENHQLKCDLVMPMAMKGEKIHSGMVFAAKTLGGLLLALLFAMFIYLVKIGAGDAR